MMGTDSGHGEASFLVYLNEKSTMYLLPAHRGYLLNDEELASFNLEVRMSVFKFL